MQQTVGGITRNLPNKRDVPFGLGWKAVIWVAQKASRKDTF